MELVDGKIRSRSNRDNALPFGRVAGTSHWSPAMLPDGMAPALRETALWSPPELEPPSRDDRINTSLTYGFVFDMCGIEIDPVSYQVRVDRYVSMHDAGRLLNPLIAEGQMRGAFVQGIATALYEEFVYDESGQPLAAGLPEFVFGRRSTNCAEGGQPVAHRLIGDGDHDAFVHQLVPIQGRLDLAQLDPVAVDLHLLVGPAVEFELAVGPPTGQVAGAVHAGRT